MSVRLRAKRALGRCRGKVIRRAHSGAAASVLRTVVLALPTAALDLRVAALALPIAASALRIAASGRRVGSAGRTTTRTRTQITGSRIRTAQQVRLRARIQTLRNPATVPEIRIKRRKLTRPASSGAI